MKNYYTEQQLADELGVGVRTVHNFRKTYGLEGIKVGRTWCHSKEQIDVFFRRNAGKAIKK